MGSEAIEMWEGKDLFSPLASKSGGAFALPTLQLVPPLATVRNIMTYIDGEWVRTGVESAPSIA